MIDTNDLSLELINKANSMLSISLLVTYKSNNILAADQCLDKEYNLLYQSGKTKSKSEILVIGAGSVTSQDLLYKLVKANEKFKAKFSETGLKVNGIVGIDCNSGLNNEKIKKKIEASSLDCYEGTTYYIYSNQIKIENKHVKIPCLASSKVTPSSISTFSVYSTETLKTNRVERVNSKDYSNRDLGSTACTIF